MTTAQFWKIIDSTGHAIGVNRRRQVEKIGKILQTLPIAEVGSFEKQVNRNLHKACTFHLMVAAFTIFSYISDESFVDFRVWLILMGSKKYTAAIKNPNSIANFLSRGDVRKISSHEFLSLPTHIWLDRGGGIHSYTKQVGHYQEPRIATPWPKSRRDFEKKYPILYKAFWNQGRINSFHEQGK